MDHGHGRYGIESWPSQNVPKSMMHTPIWVLVMEPVKIKNIVKEAPGFESFMQVPYSICSL